MTKWVCAASRILGRVSNSGGLPVYLDFDGKIMRLGEATVIGNSTTPEFKVMLPQKPKRVLINAFHDVLASESTSEQK